MIGKVFELRRLLQNRFLSPAGLRALQERKLRHVIRHACDNVPYYGSLFRGAGLSPQDIRSLDDLKHVPITAKDDLRSAGLDRTIAMEVDVSSCLSRTSSGTTGRPFTVYYDAREAQTRTLVGFRTMHTMGIRPWDRILRLRPAADAPSLMNRLGLYRTYDLPYFRPISEQIAHLVRIQPTVLRLAPSKLRALLHHVDYRLSEIVQPRMLVTVTEMFDESLKSRLLRDTDVELFNLYLSAEFGAIACDCMAHTGLHVNADQLILECLDENDQPVGPGAPGSVVVTSLCNLTMPMIRYKLGDICTSLEVQCPCGSSFPIISDIIGRRDDVLRLPSGGILSALGLGVIVRAINGIDQYQYIQEDLDHLVLQLAVWHAPSLEELSRVRAEVLEYLAEPVRFDIEIVDRLSQDKGKFRKFISKVPEAGDPLSEGRVQR